VIGGSGMIGRRFDFVVFSDDWGRHPSSCQHLFKRISRDHRVLWVNTIGLRAPKADAFTVFRGLEKAREWCRPLRQVDENLWVLAPVMLPVMGGGILGRINRNWTVGAVRRALRKLGMHSPILWTTVSTAGDYVGRLGESLRVYYVTDDYHLWPGSDAEAVRRADRELTRRADLVFACSEFLAAAHRNGRARTVLLPHAVDVGHFRQPMPEPDELKPVPRPRACFFGLIYEKIDLPLLSELAERRPDVHIVLIGPVKTNVDRLASRPNVHVLGSKPYEMLPAYLQAMDVLVVPYVLDEEIRVSSPLKIRECLAVGIPTVVRSLPDLRQFSDVLYLCEQREEFVAAVGRALAEGGTDRAERMHRRVLAETWDARVDIVLRELDAFPLGTECK
jgi:glycosyltransferase involved in cell wall biosynthesis